MADTNSELIRKDSRVETLKQRAQLMRERLFYQSRTSSILVILVVLFAIAIESGFIYILSEPTPLLGENFQFIQWDPRLSEQLVVESFIIATLIGFGTLGLYLIKRAPVYVDDKDRAATTQMIGIILLIGCFVLLYLAMVLKLFGSFNNLNIFG